MTIPAGAASELSSLASSLEEIEQRVAALAHAHDDGRHDDLVAALLDAERLVRQGVRQLRRARTLAP
ncbi:MAG: hypothetical protein ACKO91_13045 [Acidimicrobiales bacterium]